MINNLIKVLAGAASTAYVSAVQTREYKNLFEPIPDNLDLEKDSVTKWFPEIDLAQEDKDDLKTIHKLPEHERAQAYGAIMEKMKNKNKFNLSKQRTAAKNKYMVDKARAIGLHHKAEAM